MHKPLISANQNFLEIVNKIPAVDDRLQKLSTLEKLVGESIFTDIQKALKHLAEQRQILDEFDQPDFEINYHLNTALIENQLYNYKLSEIHFSKAIEILGDRGDVSQLAEAYIDYAGTLLNLEQTDKANFYLTQATNYLKSFPDQRLQAWLICRAGYFHQKNSNPAKALQAFYESKKRIEKLERPLSMKDYYFITLTQSGIGSIHHQNGEPEKSTSAYLEVVKICEQHGMKSRLSWHYGNVGNGFMEMGDFDNAILYFRKAIKVFDDVNVQARAQAYANLGYCYFRKGNFKDALELLKKAQPLFKEKQDRNLANVERWQAQIQLEQGRKKKALKHYFNALDYAKKAQDYRQITGILKNIATLYAEDFDYKNAYDYQLIYEQAIERYFMELKLSEIRELEIKYEAERREKEAEMFKLQATGLQLKALRAQMNPHFMFNVLNSIQNYITSKDTTEAAKFLAQFAHLVRQSLEYSEMEIVSLEKDIEFLEQYLSINEKLRFENQLEHEIIVDEEIEEDIYGVPTMIVQPYVENAIEHGIRPKKNGTIRITYSLKDENTILCVVEDDGIGREKAMLRQHDNPDFKSHKSLGTKITQDRLEILLKSRGGKPGVAVKTIDLKDEITGEAKGTRVEILIPIIEIQIKGSLEN